MKISEISNIDNVTYYGLSINDAQVNNEKIYFKWDGRNTMLPRYICKMLNFIDYGLRDHGFQYSISAFIIDANRDKLSIIFDYFTDMHHFNLHNEHLLDYIEDLQDSYIGTHYDPILSIKFGNNTISGISFYSGPLNDKSMGILYYRKACQYMTFFNCLPLKSCIDQMLEKHIIDTFLVS